MGIVYFLLSVIVFYYLFKFAARLLMPFFLRKMAEKMMNNGQRGFAGQTGNSNPFERYQSQTASGNNHSDGKVRVSYMPPKTEKKGRGTEKAGEFIDFEEVS